MFKQLPIKKDYLLILGTVVLLLAGYQLAFKKTLEVWQDNKQLKAQIAQNADISFQPAYLERKNNNLDKIISHYKSDTSAFRSNMISAIAVIAVKENVKLSEVPLQDPLYRTDKFIIQKLNLEGDFFSLIKVLNQLETQAGIGVIRSVNYKAIGLRQAGSVNRNLVLEIYLETLR